MHFFGPFEANFWGFWEYFWGWGQAQKDHWNLPIQSTLVLEVQHYLFVFNLETFGPFATIFKPIGTIFGVRPDSKTFFVIYLCSQSTLVLDEQSYLFVFNLTKFGAFFTSFY